MFVPHLQPFVDDKEVHIAEEGEKEEELRDELEKEIDLFAFIDAVTALHEDSNSHVQHSNDD